jgi:macrolide-specific efflux system membrane fusion protein
VGVAVVAAVAAAVVLPWFNGAPTASAQDDAPGALNFADVVVADLRQEEEYNGKLESIKGTGTIMPAAQIDLAFTTPGIISEVLVHVGQDVRTGDVLAQVDAATLFTQDEINVAQAQINVVNEIAQLEANVAMAEAAYNAARGQAAATDTNIAVSDISVAQAERHLADAQAA